MEGDHSQFLDGKVIIRVKDRLCDSTDELLSSVLFRRVLDRCIRDLSKRNSRLAGIFDHSPISKTDLDLLISALHFLLRLPADLVPKVLEGSEQFFRDRMLFNDFVEYVYNYWRSLQRLIVCDSIDARFDQRPYRTFNQTIEVLTNLARSAYRDIQENITGNHPRIYRQVRAGAEIAAIALPGGVEYPAEYAARLEQVFNIRQVLIFPPLIFNSGSNKRSGTFERVDQNPLDRLNLTSQDWLCYPARVGSLLIMVYFPVINFELNFSLCNLFELADDETLARKPDAVLIFGAPAQLLPRAGKVQTVFYDDVENGLVIGAVPDGAEFDYFGYLKKMILTLHNIIKMRAGSLPFHGALFQVSLRGQGPRTFLIMGDTGAGKSETLEAMRSLGSNDIEDLVIIADDMGSLEIDSEGKVIGYGTETGAFIRLDDLQPGYAFGQIDRTIIMNPNQTNARVVIPVTTFDTVSRGFKIDYVLYANNYEDVDAVHPVLEQFKSPDEALDVFREGKVMSKGTTSTSGMVHTYFANIFGPLQYQELHEILASRYFHAFFQQQLYVGQIRTQLGISGKEHSGPEKAAHELLRSMKDGR